jgi:predicted transcriptional regulator of viral defense system
MYTPSSGIGSKGRSELTTILRSGRRFVRPADVVAELGIDPPAAAKRLSRWASEGWLRRARRGLYIPVPVDASNPAAWSEDALAVATAVWSPCYFTGWTAASHWSLTDQVFRTTVLKTSGRVRRESVALLEHDFLVKHAAAEAMAWGLKSDWLGEVRLRFADAARTVVDILDDPRLGGGIRHAAEILVAFLDDNATDLLIDYGDRLGNRAVFKRLGYLLEVLMKADESTIAACHERVSAGIALLDPSGPPGGKHVTRWGLLVNVRVQSEEPA